MAPLKERADREKEFDKIYGDADAMRKEAGDPASLSKVLLGKDTPGKTAGKIIGDVLVVMMLPDARKMRNAQDKSEQVERNLQVAFALAAYRLDHGNYPAKLDDLAPKYLAVVPDDLFSGAALVYRPAEKGYQFYSVGVNGKGDGGRSFGDDPAGDDLPVSMPLPELKRKK